MFWEGFDWLHRIFIFSMIFFKTGLCDYFKVPQVTRKKNNKRSKVIFFFYSHLIRKSRQKDKRQKIDKKTMNLLNYENFKLRKYLNCEYVLLFAIFFEQISEQTEPTAWSKLPEKLKFKVKIIVKVVKRLPDKI